MSAGWTVGRRQYWAPRGTVGRIDEICPRADGVGSGSRLTDLILALSALSAVSAAVTADSAS